MTQSNSLENHIFSESSKKDILEELNRILSSNLFSRSSVLSNFLKFIVEETLEGNTDGLKEYTIAVSALGKSPDFNPQTDAIIRILENENINKANGVPSIWRGVYEEMKKNPPKKKLALEEYLVGGSALSASLIENFEKDFGIKGVQAWGMTETSPLGTASRLQKKHESLSEKEQIKIDNDGFYPFYHHISVG